MTPSVTGPGDANVNDAGDHNHNEQKYNGNVVVSNQTLFSLSWLS